MYNTDEGTPARNASTTALRPTTISSPSGRRPRLAPAPAPEPVSAPAAPWRPEPVSAPGRGRAAAGGWERGDAAWVDGLPAAWAAARRCAGCPGRISAGGVGPRPSSAFRRCPPLPAEAPLRCDPTFAARPPWPPRATPTPPRRGLPAIIASRHSIDDQTSTYGIRPA